MKYAVSNHGKPKDRLGGCGFAAFASRAVHCFAMALRRGGARRRGASAQSELTIHVSSSVKLGTAALFLRAQQGNYGPGMSSVRLRIPPDRVSTIMTEMPAPVFRVMARR